MSKNKAIIHGTLGAYKVVSAIGAVTGHSALHLVASAFRIKLPHNVAMTFAKMQMSGADEQFKKASQEWNRET